MKIFSWNVNGIRAVINKGEFNKFIELYKPDILGIQETKAQPGQVEIDLPNYQEYWNSAEKKGYSGTAIFTKEKPLNVTYGLGEIESNEDYVFNDSYGDTRKEGRVTTAEYKDFFYVTVYTPNSKGDLSRLEHRSKTWDPAFLNYINLLQSKKPVIFCGDLNVAHQEIDLANPKANLGKHGFTDEERSGFQNILDSGFVDIYRHFYPNKEASYTWWTHWANSRARNIGWRIDYFLVSESLVKRVKSAEIHPEIMGSDHCPVSIEIE